MTEANDHSAASPLDALRRYVPLAVWAIVILVILAIPLKIIGYGFLPGDDALRHAAKAVSGKPWPEILVMGPAFQVDHNFGWHFLLRQVYLRSQHDTDARDTEKLVLLSVVAPVCAGQLVGAAVVETAGSLADRPDGGDAYVGCSFAIFNRAAVYFNHCRAADHSSGLAGSWFIAAQMVDGGVDGRGDCRLHFRSRGVVSLGIAGGGLFSGRTISVGIDADCRLGGRIICGRGIDRASA